MKYPPRRTDFNSNGGTDGGTEQLRTSQNPATTVGTGQVLGLWWGGHTMSYSLFFGSIILAALPRLHRPIATI